jgi:hypothetical protein
MLEASFQHTMLNHAQTLGTLSQSELLLHWQVNYFDLDGYSFIRAIDGDCNLPLRQSLEFNFGVSIYGLFATDRLLFVNNNVITNTFLLGGTSIQIDATVGFDANIVRYLAEATMGRETATAKMGHSLLEFLVVNKLNYDFFPYIVENFKNASSSEKLKHGKFAENLRALEILKDLDEECYLFTRKIQPQCSESVLNARIEALEIYLLEQHTYNLRHAVQHQKRALLFLLEASYACFNRSLQTASEKVVYMLEFCHSTLGAMVTRELLFVLPLLVTPQHIRQQNPYDFFRKVQIGKQGLLADLENMAWDLQIPRFQEQIIGYDQTTNKFRIPFFVTADKGLMKVLESYRLQSLLFHENGLNTAQPWNIVPQLQGIVDGWEHIFERYFSEFGRLARANRQPVEDLTPLIEKAKQKLLTVL